MHADSWATYTLMEAPFWRNGMSLIEYEIERDYFHKNIDLWGTPEYVPIWKQLASGESKSKALPKVLTAELLVGIIESGSDIIFSFKGKRYIIISKDCMVSDQHDEKEARFFDTPRELMSNYVIDGQTLEQHLKEIEVIYIT